MLIVVYDHDNNGVDIRSTFTEYLYPKKSETLNSPKWHLLICIFMMIIIN